MLSETRPVAAVPLWFRYGFAMFCGNKKPCQDRMAGFFAFPVPVMKHRGVWRCMQWAGGEPVAHPGTLPAGPYGAGAAGVCLNDMDQRGQTGFPARDMPFPVRQVRKFIRCRQQQAFANSSRMNRGNACSSCITSKHSTHATPSALMQRAAKVMQRLPEACEM